MRYCPYCSEPLKANTKTCPYCHKALDLSQLAGMYKEGESSHINRSAKRGVWFRENALMIYPVIALLIGLVAGAISAYSYAMVANQSQVNSLENRIVALQDSIGGLHTLSASSNADFNQQLAIKDSIIQILDEQKLTISKIITFTRRLARNSTITENTPGQADFYDRNVRYLIRQFNNQQQQLQATGYQNVPDFNLKSIPQLIRE